VTGVTAYSAAIHATHLPPNAAWFGRRPPTGAVALNPATQDEDTRREAVVATMEPTGAALGATGAAYLNGPRLGEALAASSPCVESPGR